MNFKAGICNIVITHWLIRYSIVSKIGSLLWACVEIFYQDVSDSKPMFITLRECKKDLIFEPSED